MLNQRQAAKNLT